MFPNRNSSLKLFHYVQVPFLPYQFDSWRTEVMVTKQIRERTLAENAWEQNKKIVPFL